MRHAVGVPHTWDSEQVNFRIFSFKVVALVEIKQRQTTTS